MEMMTRRSVLRVAAGVGVATVMSSRLSGVLAQTATPVIPMFGDYPLLTVTVTDAAYVLSSNSVPAGIVHFVVTNKTSGPTSAVILGPPAGKSMADLQASMATPTVGNGFPAFLYDAIILGGPQTMAAGETKEALLNVPAGDWIVLGDGQQPPTSLTSAVSAASKTNEPAADAEIIFGDFTFNGFENVMAGEHLWKISNKGVQPHMLVLAKVPAGTTEAQLMASFEGDGSGTPAAGSVPQDQIQDLTDGVFLLSTKQTMWLAIDLSPATYAAVCFVTDPTNGKSHAMEGMVKVFKVA